MNYKQRSKRSNNFKNKKELYLKTKKLVKEDDFAIDYFRLAINKSYFHKNLYCYYLLLNIFSFHFRIHNFNPHFKEGLA